MPGEALYIGLDLGTSGARAIAMTGYGTVVAGAGSRMKDHGDNIRDPNVWWSAAKTALHGALSRIRRTRVVAICVDGTSGTMIPVDAGGVPLGLARMYNDPCEDAEILQKIARFAPRESAAHGVTGGLAKALVFQARYRPARVLHQADWIAGRLCGVFASDDNNALKTGFDPIARDWPAWLGNTGLDASILPDVNPPGTQISTILPETAGIFGLVGSVRVVAGTTDGCASFLATGAEKPGDGVSALGSTLTIKMLSETPIFDPDCGVYSHRILGAWLAGGASNSGGNVLLAHFTPPELKTLSDAIDPDTDTGLDYYPLLTPGERFPVSDPELAPRMTPVPASRAEYLKAMFEGIADIEARGYARLGALGGPVLTSVRSVGGGAQNPAWTRLRARRLGVEMAPPLNTEAAYGAARLARYGMNRRQV